MKTMDTEITIEQATLSDLDAILEIENQCFDSDQFSKAQFVYLITNSKGVFYLIKAAGRAVAYLSLLTHARNRYLRVYSIAVHPEGRGKKLAWFLLDKAIGYARLHQLKAITLEVKVSNVPAISLYEKIGFVKVSVKRNYYHDGSDAYYMKLLIKREGEYA